MPNLIVVILPDIDRCQDVLETWERLGVTGITIVESTGLHKLKQMRGRARSPAADALPAPPPGERRVPSPDGVRGGGR